MSHEVYWGSHGCKFDESHNGWCDCGCCECEPDHPYTGTNVACVATFPYYGSITKFYGDDADWAQAKLDAAMVGQATLP